MKNFWERIMKTLRDPATQTAISIITIIITCLVAIIARETLQAWLVEIMNWLLKSTYVANWAIVILGIISTSLVISWLRVKTHKIQQAPKIEDQKQLPLTSIDIYSISPRPKEIIDQIDTVPPFQKNNIQKSYEGIKVKWRLEFWDIVDTDKNIAWLQLNGYEKHSNANIYIHADMEMYPRIKTLKREESLFVVAEIKEITDYHTIWLINAIIKFSEEE